MLKTKTHKSIDRCIRITLALVLTLSSVVTPELAYSIPNFSGGGGREDGFEAQDCPPETQRRPEDCEDVERAAYALAMKKGYADGDGNGIPDVMESGYRYNENDCTTGNAHVACMFNDECTAQWGELKGLRSNSAHHATTMFVGADGQQMECDFTPGGGAGLIGDNADTTMGDAVPDAGESMDPAYVCKMNGANYGALNPGGKFGGSSMQNMMMMMMLMQLLQQMQNQKQNQNQNAVPTQAPQVVIVTATPTPTPTPTTAPTVQGEAKAQFAAPAQDKMTLPPTEFPGLVVSPTVSGG
jgi:hypothetical protein